MYLKFIVYNIYIYILNLGLRWRSCTEQPPEIFEILGLIFAGAHKKRTSCYKSANKLLQICSQAAVDKLCSHCLFPVVVTSLEQAVDNLCNKFDGIIIKTCYKVVLTSLIQSWYNKNVTRLTTQDCNNIVISWLYRTCWNNLATSLMISTSLLQVANSLFQTCWQLGASFFFIRGELSTSGYRIIA